MFWASLSLLTTLRKMVLCLMDFLLLRFSYKIKEMRYCISFLFIKNFPSSTSGIIERLVSETMSHSVKFSVLKLKITLVIGTK